MLASSYTIAVIARRLQAQILMHSGQIYFVVGSGNVVREIA